MRADPARRKVVYDLNNLTGEDWDKLPADYRGLGDPRWDGITEGGGGRGGRGEGRGRGEEPGAVGRVSEERPSAGPSRVLNQAQAIDDRIPST